MVDAPQRLALSSDVPGRVARAFRIHEKEVAGGPSPERWSRVPWKYTEEYYREYTRQTWNEYAELYVRMLQFLEPYGNHLLERVAARPGEEVLDIATGPGEPAMALAQIVSPQGHVTGIDLSEKMVDLACRVATSRGLPNVTFRTMDAERLEFPDDTFDLITSRFGFQIFTNPEKVAREAHRVLKRG